MVCQIFAKKKKIYLYQIGKKIENWLKETLMILVLETLYIKYLVANQSNAIKFNTQKIKRNWICVSVKCDSNIVMILLINWFFVMRR